MLQHGLGAERASPAKQPLSAMKDRKGNTVNVGDSVRVISFEESILKNLTPEERNHVKSMVGGIFEVEEIDEYGCAWVTKWWDRGHGKSESHSLSLKSSNMEKIANGR